MTDSDPRGSGPAPHVGAGVGPDPWNDPAATPYVRLRGLTKRFGEFVAVDNVSLDIFEGELFCLLGASGCGKSTLLRMLAGFEVPTFGEIAIDGANVSAVPPYERPVNMMFQSYALFPHMSVAGNVAFGLKQDKVARPEIERRVGDMLELVKLGAFASRRPHQLSGGQRQRVALARALVKRPKLLLLDEPLGALDKKLREETQFELLNIQEETGVTFVIVTHDQDEAMTLSTRIGVMEAGRIVQTGTPTEIYEQPASRFVADFVGSVNLFEGRIEGQHDGLARVGSAEAGGEILVEHAAAVATGTQVWVALRPEKIALSREPPADAANRAGGAVDEIAYTGNLSVYLVALDSGKRVRVTVPNLARGAGDRFTWEERVWLTWPAASGVVLTG